MDLSRLRSETSYYRAEEINFNEVSKMISFRVGFARVNIYYTTGTVGTCIDHPISGETQLFRRNQTIYTMASIFNDPRVHTGAGNYQIADRNDKKRKLNDEETIDEEDALKEQLQLLSQLSA
jgi:hypothetical protein